MTKPAPDGNLPAAKRELSDAISKLIDPKPHTIHHDDNTTSIRWIDSLYTQLVEAIPGEKRHRTGVSESQPPMWIGALDQLRHIDRTVTTWEPHWPLQLPSTWPFAYDDEHPTVQRLRILDKRGWRPQDCKLIDTYTDKILGWCDKIRELLNDTPKLTLPNSCPNCETRICYRPDPDGGPPLRSPALQIGTDGCTCQHCRYTWEPSHFALLAEVLGYQPIEGVLT